MREQGNEACGREQERERQTERASEGEEESEREIEMGNIEETKRGQEA